MKELNGMMRDAFDVRVEHAASEVVSYRVIDALRDQVRDSVWYPVGWAFGDVVRMAVRDEVKRIQ